VNRKPIIVACAWGEDWKPYADRLSKNANVLELDCVVDLPEGSPRNPLEAWKRKPQIMLEVLGNRRPVLLVDVDSVIHSSIDPMGLIDCDIAAYSSRPGVWEDGTVLVQPTPAARAVLERWDELCRELRWYGEKPVIQGAGRATQEQKNHDWTNLALSQAILELRPTVVNLGPEFCWNHEWAMKERFGPRTPVIEPNVA